MAVMSLTIVRSVFYNCRNVSFYIVILISLYVKVRDSFADITSVLSSVTNVFPLLAILVLFL